MNLLHLLFRLPETMHLVMGYVMAMPMLPHRVEQQAIPIHGQADKLPLQPPAYAGEPPIQ